MLTAVTRDGVNQKTLHRWPDVIGRTIQPEPIADWAKWNSDLIRRFTGVSAEVVDLSGLSRVQREMAERKAAKAVRRAGAR
jgi:hypothetical protein